MDDSSKSSHQHVQPVQPTCIAELEREENKGMTSGISVNVLLYLQILFQIQMVFFFFQSTSYWFKLLSCLGLFALYPITTIA